MEVNSKFQDFIKSQNVDIIRSEFSNYNSMLLMYRCGIKEAQTKLEILNEEFKAKAKRNPIEYIKSRVKSIDSIVEKLQRKNLPLTSASAQENLMDIAGVRVICAFVDDIYRVARMFEQQDDITIICVKDYIRNPKPNGYRSYHVVVEVPVFFSTHVEPVRVEVQIRTIAMDFWATLEHDLYYKEKDVNSEELYSRLKKCADTITETDGDAKKSGIWWIIYN